MPKKTASSTQVRIDPDLRVLVSELMETCEFKVSMNSFVNVLIRRGVDATREQMTRRFNANTDK